MYYSSKHAYLTHLKLCALLSFYSLMQCKVLQLEILVQKAASQKLRGGSMNSRFCYMLLYMLGNPYLSTSAFGYFLN